MWLNHPFFKYVTGIILLLITLYFLLAMDLLHPVFIIVKTLFYPILLAGFLYYVLQPIVKWLTRIPFLPKSVSILFVFSFIGGILYALYLLFAASIQKQVEDISSTLPEDLKEMGEKAKQKVEENDLGMLSVESIQQKTASFSSNLMQMLGDNMTEIISTVTGATTVLVVVPFVLFYFLKDDARFVPFLMKAIPPKWKEEISLVLHKIDDTLSSYIYGQITVAIVDGVLMYIAYLIIGIDYALILGIFVTLTAVVPFFGPIIGVIPALVVSLTQSPALAIYVLVSLVIVQQLEGNLVAPVVFGKRLNIHPLTIILLLIVAAALYGFVGMLIAIPFYTIIKIVVVHAIDIVLRKKGRTPLKEN